MSYTYTLFIQLYKMLTVLIIFACVFGVTQSYRLNPTIEVNKWKERIPYWIENFPDDLDNREVLYQLNQAMEFWENLLPHHHFHRIMHRSEADNITEKISILCGMKDHAGHNFSAPHIIAHAHHRILHFNKEDYNWTLGFPQEYEAPKNVFTIAAHELGHCLCLSHSQNRRALMYYTF